MATMQSRVANVELRVKVAESQLTNLPDNYVPRIEIQRGDRLLREQRDEDRQRLDRLETKIDLLLESDRKRR